MFAIAKDMMALVGRATVVRVVLHMRGQVALRMMALEDHAIRDQVDLLIMVRGGQNMMVLEVQHMMVQGGQRIVVLAALHMMDLVAHVTRDRVDLVIPDQVAPVKIVHLYAINS